MIDRTETAPCVCHTDARTGIRDFTCTYHLLKEFERAIFERVKTAQQMNLQERYHAVRSVWRAAQRALKEIEKP